MELEEWKFKEIWEQRTRNGRWAYAIKYGLRWSLLTSVAVAFFQYYILRAKDSENLVWTLMLNTAVICTAGILVYYFIIWRLYQKKYDQMFPKE